MKSPVFILSVASAFGLSACVESTAPADDGLSGTPAQFDSMAGPCISQAARLTETSTGTISVSDRIRTGGGPLLVLDVAGTKYSCRMEDDGSVTVFSEFAN